MNRIVTYLTFIAVLCVSLASQAYNTTDTPVFTSMLVADMEQLLASQASTGLTYESGSAVLSGTTVHYIMINFLGDTATVLFMGNVQISQMDPLGVRRTATAYESLQMFSFVRASGGAIACTGINEWNRQYRGSRAYIDGDGDAVLEADLYLADGVTAETVLSFVKRYFTALVTFREFLD